LTAIKWRNDSRLEIVSASRNTLSNPRRFLVFVVLRGDRPSPLLTIADRRRNFDIAIRLYDEPRANAALLNSAEFVMTGGLSKMHAASLFIDACGLSDVYDGYFFLDGDLEFDAGLLSSFLSFASAARLDLAQPSLTRDSYCYWKMAYCQPCYLLRKTSFVEVMAPYFSRNALSKTLHTFTRSISTYGLDLVWPSIIGSKEIGVVDAFRVRHSERVNHETGKFYTYLKSIGVDLDQEEETLLAEYGVTPEQAHSRRGFFWSYPGPLSRRPPRLISVEIPEPEKRLQKQITIDLAMRLAKWKRMDVREELDLAVSVEPHLRRNLIAPVPVD